MAGFTTVRDLGGSGVNISLRNAINKGEVIGPRIFTAGKAIGTTGGHADPTNGWKKSIAGDPGPQDGVINGVDDARKAVRERYKNGAFIAFHGSTNRSPYPQAGYVVGFIPFKDGLPSGELEIFADGLAQVDVIKEMKDAKYRPMGLAEGKDGSLYISDSKKGKIWRVAYTADKTSFTDENLKEMELRKYLPHIKTPVEFQDIVK